MRARRSLVLQQRLRQQLSLKVAAAFFVGLAAILAQDQTSYLTPDVARVGEKLACRCGGCRNTVGNCPMIRCGSADPKRKRIFEMKKAGLSDTAIVDRFVQEEGAVALSAPPTASIGGLITWMMPGVALLIGFWIWLRYVRGNREELKSITAKEQAAMDRFRGELEDDFDEAPGKR